MQDPSSTMLHAHPERWARRMMQKAHNLDGLPEIGAGIFFLLAAAFIYAQMILPPRSPGFIAAWLGSSFVLPVLLLGLPKAIRTVRSRYLVERAGYVKPKPLSARTKALAAAQAMVVSIAVMVMVPRLAHSEQWVLAGSGVSYGILAWMCGRSARFAVLGGIMAATGLAVASRGVSLSAGFALLWGVSGVAVLLSGVMVLFRFVRTRPGD